MRRPHAYDLHGRERRRQRLRRWHHHHGRFKHSLGARLIAVFLLLALLSSAILWGAMDHALSLWLAVPALQLGDVSLAELVREQAQPGLALVIEDGLPLLKLHRLRVQLLLRNLVHNALRHNDATRGEVQLSLSRDGAGQRLTVRDFGPGVPDDALAQLGATGSAVLSAGRRAHPA